MPAAAPATTAHSQPLTVPLLPVSHESVREPVPVLVEFTEGQVIIVDAVTGVFGSGDDAEPAISDLLAALRDHLDLLSGEAALSPDLRKQVEYLRRHLR